MISPPGAPLAAQADEPLRPPAPPPPKLDQSLRAAVNDEQLNMVLGHTRLGTIMATAFAVFLALALRGVALQPWIIDVWLLAKLVVAAVRVWLSLRYDRAGRPGGLAWRRTTDLWLTLDGTVWGIAGFLMMSSPMPLASLVGAVMACVSCVATFGLQHSKRSTAAYVGPIVLLTSLGLYLRGDEFGTIGGTGMLTLLALLLATAVGSERRLAEGLQLRLHAQALTAEKDEALKLATRESAAKTQFIRNISHELRTPLHGILGVARLLHLQTGGNGNSELARKVELIESSGMHLLGLINDLLEIARLESGRFTVRSERFDLAELVKTLADVYTVRAGEMDLSLGLDLAIAQPGWVRGDPARVRQVLHNLLGNAVKFTREGSITIRVSREAATELVTIEVRDTGPGISSQDLQQVFEAFRQAGAHQGRTLEGTGLGLFISRDIARAMGGDLVLQSEVGVGTTALFTAHLPSATEEAATAAIEPEVVPPTEGLRVLIAEDDDVNALIATAYLEQQGMQCERARDGAQAVRHALRDIQRPDLILMDCQMPGMDGFAATREIRAQEHALALTRVPIVALTANCCDATRKECVDAGMDGFLCKPYTIDELLRAMRKLVPQYEPLAAS
ncbi:MAG TPA: ATP-binding protein [Rubrivivax sp.]|nr:response regulator [Burkholderiales bacterium]HNU12202.1 ATP-binding protein [Rubrivivax sp.]